ncbi:MAG: MFS transporter [Alphaproteobacteria bacterium]|nr:MFS transporter [Alphaproteobacteria bacterium]
MVVVAVAALALCLIMGARQTFGLFLQPITSDLGWGRETFALSMAVQNLLWGLAQPFVGAVADRYGSGRVLALGTLGYAAGLYLMSVSTTATEFHWSAGVLVGVTLSATTFAVILGAVGRAVPPQRQSMALGLASAGGSFGQFAMIPTGQAFITAYGWSTALVLLAALSLLVVPLAALLTGRAEGGAGRAGGDQSLRQALAEARRHSGFLYLTTGFFVCGFQVVFIGVHFPAYLTDNEITPARAALALGLIGFFNIIGSLGCGALGARYSKKGVLTVLYLARGVATLLFLVVPISDLSVLLYASVIGLLWLGTVPLTSGLVAQVFGPRYLTTLFGIVFFSHQLGAFLGVWLGGYLFDATGSYDIVWWLVVALSLAAALLHWPIDERALPRLATAG